MRSSLIHGSVTLGCLAILTAACGGTTTEQGVGPVATRCQIAVTAPQAIPPAASTVTMSITTARDCTWNVSTDAGWVKVSPAAGQGAGSVSVSVADNPQTRPRTALIAVNESTVSISQDGVPCRFHLGTQQAHIDFEGARTSVGVTTTDDCEWRASTGSNWIRVLTDRGTGSGNVELDVGRNDGAERSATVSIAGLPFVVSQGGLSASPSPPSPPLTCAFTIDSDRASFRAQGGQGSIRIVTDPGCNWNAASQAPWLSLSRAAGNGPDTLQYTVAAHTSTTADRAGTLTVAGRTHTVNQQACALSIDPPSQTFGSPGGDGSVRVITDAGCQWAATSTGDWLSIAQSGGSGPGALQYRVGVNVSTTSERNGTVSVAGRTHGVRQMPFRPEEIVAEGILSNVSGSCPAFTFAVGGRVFVTDSGTSFDACDKVRNGIRAYVRGNLLPDGRVVATKVDIDD